MLIFKIHEMEEGFFFDFDFNNNLPSRMGCSLISNCTFNWNIAMNEWQGNSICNKLTDDKTMSTYEIVSQSTKLNLNDVEFQLSKKNLILFNLNQVQIQVQTYQNAKTNTNSILKFETEKSVSKRNHISLKANQLVVSFHRLPKCSPTLKILRLKTRASILNHRKKVTINQCNFSNCTFKDPIKSTKGGAVCLLNMKENSVQINWWCWRWNLHLLWKFDQNHIINFHKQCCLWRCYLSDFDKHRK